MSIFNIPDWNPTTEWKKNEIVKYGGYSYYVLKNLSENSPFNEDNFGGYLHREYYKPYFFWTPSYRTEIKENFKLRQIQFDDGHDQRSFNGINSSNLEINISFNDRDDLEARAILNFFHERAGTESFYFKPPIPYDNYRIFICQEWEGTKTYLNTNSIKAKFIEKYN